jgi:tetratricopeptide (TPR) repeat protein
MKYQNFLKIGLPFFIILGMLSIPSSAQNSRRPALIRDTDIADGKDDTEIPQAKEHNPTLAAKNVNIGNQYLKSKNYVAAINRYLEALEYDEKSIPAYEALSKAYEKNGDIAKSIQALKTLLEINPKSPKAAKYRDRLAKLEKTVQ